MTYTVTSFDGNFTIAPLAFDTSNTALSLPGKDYSGWGEPYTNNFTHLLENFAYTNGNAPSVLRTGMLWYNTTTSTLELYDKRTGWTSIGAAAGKLSTARTISLSGAATGSASFDGSANVTIPMTLVPSGVTAGNYLSANISVDVYGRVTSASTGLTGNDLSTPVESFNTRIGAVTLTAQDVINALGYTPTNGGITSLSASAIDSALGYTPANDALVLHLAGGTMTGQINMNGNRIINVGAPVSASDAARLTDVQSVSSSKTQRVYNGTGETSYNVTVSSSPPSGGSDGDVWYVY